MMCLGANVAVMDCMKSLALDRAKFLQAELSVDIKVRCNEFGGHILPKVGWLS